MFACFRNVFENAFKPVQPQQPANQQPANQQQANQQQANQQQANQQQAKEITEMTNGEAQSEGPQPQSPATPTVGEPSAPAVEAISPDNQQAQSEFSDITRALTDRRASLDPQPGWVLPRVDDRAAFSDPTLNTTTTNQ